MGFTGIILYCAVHKTRDRLCSVIATYTTQGEYTVIEFYLFQLPIPLVWLAAGILIAGTELLFPTNVSMWSGLAAVSVAFFIWSGILDEYAWTWQLFWFALLSMLFILVWFFVIKKYTRLGSATVDEHRDISLYDIKGIATEDIDPDSPGAVELFSSYHGIKKWKAEADCEIKAGEKVSVQDADGIKLIVKKL